MPRCCRWEDTAAQKGTTLDLDALLQYLVEHHGSDLHVKVGSVPRLRVDGRLVETPFEHVDPKETERIAFSILPSARADELASAGEVDFAHSVSGLGRFRVNVFRQRGSIALVFRYVAPGTPTFESLGLPPGARRLADEQRGLVLVTGPAGSGKTTTVASMIDHINESRAANIVTIEDPVEILHRDKRSIVSQREIGTDTRDYPDAMRRVLRQDPDVIYVGELRDVETVSAVLAAAETGHLVLTTLHTRDAVESIQRLVEFFPHHQHRQVRLSLASALRGVVSQRLLDRADGRGRVLAAEVLVADARIFEGIADHDRSPAQLRELIADGDGAGMQTFDQSLLELSKNGVITLRDAVAMATDPHGLRLALQQAGVVDEP